MSVALRSWCVPAMVLAAAVQAFPTTAALAQAEPHPSPARPERRDGAKPERKEIKAELPTRAIAIAINGDDIEANPAPRVVNGRLLVPIVRIYGALGIEIARRGSDLVAQAPGKRIELHIGSQRAAIDNRSVEMESPATEIDGATFVPLRFVADSLGAQVSYDPKAARVDVISSLIGRTPALERNDGAGNTQIVGTVTAVDLNSAPESVTVSRSGSIRSVAITSDAKILLQDTVARTSTPATLADVHTGDAVSAILAKDGRVESVIVRFASRTGVVGAVTPTALVMRDGHVVSADRATTVTLNGIAAALADAKVGDAITVRSNPDTGEKRQILLSRAVPSTPQPAAGSVAISALRIDAAPALRAGDKLAVTLTGTPGGAATFDIGEYVTGIAMHEDTPGTYRATYTVPANVNFGEVPVYGHLAVGNVQSPRAEAPTLVAVSTTPPTINDFAPPGGQTVNNPTPSIFATFRSPTNIAINPSSVTINVNGLDVTASSYRTASFVTYSPSLPLRDGEVNVRISVADAAGNTAERTWSFTIRAH